MATTGWGGDYFNVVRSWITEANPANWPSEACVDILNMEINPGGEVLRRLGIVEELTGGALAATAPNSGEVVSTHLWRDAGGKAGNDIILIQKGLKLYAYGNSSPLSKYYVGMVTLTPEVTTLTAGQSPIAMASINGDAVIVHPALSPKVLSLEEPGGLSLTPIKLSIRVQESISRVPVTSRPTTLDHVFEFDLRNAGWPYRTQVTKDLKGSGAQRADPVRYTKEKLGFYPALSDIFYQCKTAQADKPDALDTYSPWELQKQESGSGFSVNGRFFTDAFSLDTGALMDGAYVPLPPGSPEWQDLLAKMQALFPGFAPSFGQEGGPLTTGTVKRSTDSRPTAVAQLNGRVVYAGRDYNGAYCLFFSQLAVDKFAYGKCYQEADPTAEDINDLLATDGGVIRAPAMGSVLRMMEINSQLIIFSTTGVWALDGGGNGDAFAADSFRITQLDKEKCVAPLSIVAVGDTLLFFGENGIHSISSDPNTGGTSVTNITLQTIQKFYDNLPLSARIKAVGAADPTQGRVEWTMVLNDDVEYYTLILVLDLRNGGWRKHRVPYGDNRILIPMPPFGTTSSGEGAITINNLVTTTGDRITDTAGVPLSYRSSELIADPIGALRQFRYLASTQQGAGLRVVVAGSTTFRDWYGVATTPRDAEGYIEFPYLYNGGGQGATKRGARASAQYINAFTLRGRLL